jgi:RNAse (barnase) inhibitor barstar
MLILLIVIAFLVSHHCLNFLFTIQTKFGFNIGSLWKMLTQILTSALSIETKYYLHVPLINKLRMRETQKQIASLEK